MYLDELVRQAYSHHQQGRLDLAEPLYAQTLAANPDHVDANYLFGVLAIQTQNFALAEKHLRHAIRLNPLHAHAFAELGKAVSYQKRFAESLTLLKQAVAMMPSLHVALHDIATSWVSMGLFEQAVECLQHLTSLVPESFESWVHLGCAFHGMGKPFEAVAALTTAIQLNPSLPEAHFNLGRSLSQLGRFQEAAAALEQVLRLSPDDAETLSLLINQCQHAALWDRCEELTPRVLDLVKDCDPKNLQAPFGLVEPSSFISLSSPTSLELQWRCARSWAMARFPTDPNPFPATARTGEKIRLGYVSADFRQHVMGSHLVGLFEAHDRKRFEVFGYSIGPDDQSSLRRRIETALDHFRDLGTALTPDIAKTIHGDQIDILIDLQGYSSMSRPGVYAKKPAPIQVAYLGFPSTMGCDYIDYVLVDEYVAPDDSQRYFNEQLVQLPGCYQVNDHRLSVDDSKPTRKEAGLPDSIFVFCSFNNIFKINRLMFDSWMRILTRVEQSVLWLPAFNACAMTNLKNEAAKWDVDPSRILFAPVLPLPQHIARHGLANLFLDTFPYNAHGTAALSLRTNVPIVTMSGETMASRVAGSLLRELGLKELITQNTHAYESLAVRLATDRAYYSAIQSALKAGLASTDLFDGVAFARKVERAYEVMMELERGQQKPMGFQLRRDGSVRWLRSKDESSSLC
jgi:protein O-GlcNAc transferase